MSDTFYDIEFFHEIDVEGVAVELVYRFDFNYTAGRPAKLFVAPEDCYPEERAEVEVFNCEEETINDEWVQVDFSKFESALNKAAFEYIESLD